MPYIVPSLALIDFRHFQAGMQSTKARYPSTDAIPDLDLEWTAEHFPGNWGRSVLIRFGLTVSMLWNDEGQTTRFVITVERMSNHAPLPESEIARGDAAAPSMARHSLTLESFYGPIACPMPGEKIRFRAKWATLSSGTSVIEKGDVGINELRACAYIIG